MFADDIVICCEYREQVEESRRGSVPLKVGDQSQSWNYQTGNKDKNDNMKLGGEREEYMENTGR